jgi:hypothetical protein
MWHCTAEIEAVVKERLCLLLGVLNTNLMCTIDDALKGLSPSLVGAIFLFATVGTEEYDLPHSIKTPGSLFLRIRIYE